MITAIPTRYKDILFRSRLEAKWAAFFDQCGWQWEYEPEDLAGWVPDFILIGEKPIPVEVKPFNWVSETDMSDTIQTHELLNKVRANVTGEAEALVLGAYIFFDHSSYGTGEIFLGGLVDPARPEPAMPDGWVNSQDLACITESEKVPGRLDFRACYGSYAHRISGEYNGGHWVTPPHSRIKTLWAKACNAVRWNPHGWNSN